MWLWLLIALICTTCNCPWGEYGTSPSCSCEACPTCNRSTEVRLGCGGDSSGTCGEGCKVVVPHALIPACAENVNAVPINNVCSLRCEAGYDPNLVTKTCVSPPQFHDLSCNKRCTTETLDTDLGVEGLDISDREYKSGESLEDVSCGSIANRVGKLSLLCTRGTWQILQGRCYFFRSQFTDWSNCSVTCGSGARNRTLICYMAATSGEVHVDNCVSEGVTETAQTESCGDACPTPFYHAGDWGVCQGACNAAGVETRSVDEVWADCDTCSRTKPKAQRACWINCDLAISEDNSVGDDLDKMFALADWTATVSFLVSLASVGGVLVVGRNVSSDYFEGVLNVGAHVVGENTGSRMSLTASFQSEVFRDKAVEKLSAQWNDDFTARCVATFDEESCIVTQFVLNTAEKPQVNASNWKVWHTLLIAGCCLGLVIIVTCFVFVPKMLRALREQRKRESKRKKREKKRTPKKTSPEEMKPKEKTEEELFQKYEEEMNYYIEEIILCRGAPEKPPQPQPQKQPQESEPRDQGQGRIRYVAATQNPADHSEWRKPRDRQRPDAEAKPVAACDAPSLPGSTYHSSSKARRNVDIGYE